MSLASREVEQTRRISLGDHQTCVADVGSGDPIVLLHSIGLDHAMWAGVVSALGAYRCIAYDLRGHGCAAGAPRPFQLKGFAADLQALLDALELPRAHVVGLSLGGAIAQVFALAYPERLSAVSLVCTTAVSSPVYLQRAKAALAGGMASTADSTLQRWFTPAALAQDAPFVRYARERLLTDDPEDFAAAWRALAGLDTLVRLGEIRVPAKVIAGEVDLSTPPAVMEELAARIPEASFNVVPNGPHMLSLERPQELAALLVG